MTEKQLISLGFERQDQDEECYGTSCEKAYHYYTLDISDIAMITTTDEESGKSRWAIYVDENMLIKISKYNEAKKLIDVLKRNYDPDRTIN